MQYLVCPVTVGSALPFGIEQLVAEVVWGKVLSELSELVTMQEVLTPEALHETCVVPEEPVNRVGLAVIELESVPHAPPPLMITLQVLD